MRPLRIAMIGQRGVPATYGGVERHVEELGSRLASRGHDVTVFCRTNYADAPCRSHRGMTLEHVRTIGTKHLDAIVHSGLSTARTVRRDFDIVHYHALGPGVMAPVPRLLRTAGVVQTIHGMDNERAKWSPAARGALGLAAWMAAHIPHLTITVSEALASIFRDRYGREALHIPNGVEPGVHRPPGAYLARLGLNGAPYLLFVGRFVPEKAPDLLVRAFRAVPGDVGLVLAGGSSFTDEYTRVLRRLAADDDRVVLPGFVYGRDLEELYANAAAFVLPSTLEGLPLTLLEAASYGTPVIASAIPPHVEVLGRSAPGHVLFRTGDAAALTTALRTTLAAPSDAQRGARGLRDSVLRRYDWDAVSLATEAAYANALRRRAAVHVSPARDDVVAS